MRVSANWPHLEPSLILWHSTWRECSFRYDINQQFPLFAMRRVEREVLSAEKCEMLVLIDLWCKCCSLPCSLARYLKYAIYCGITASLNCTLRASFSRRRTCWNCLNFITKLITVTAELFPNMSFVSRHVLPVNGCSLFDNYSNWALQLKIETLKYNSRKRSEFSDERQQNFMFRACRSQAWR